MAVGPLQLPQYQQAGDLNWAPLAELGKTLQTNNINNQRKEALSLSALGQGGAVDYGKAANTLASLGDIEGASKFAAMQKALSPESTPDIQNYNYAAKNPAFLPYLKQQAEAKATKINNTTNVSNVGEREYDKALNKELADTFLGYQKAGRTATGALNTLNYLEALTKNPNFYSGTGGELATSGKQALVSMGITTPDSASPNEAFKALSNKLTLDAAGGSLGAQISNSDVKFLQAINPNLTSTPEGNREIIGYHRKVYQRQQEAARMARDYAKSHGGRIDAGFDQVVSDYAEKNPLFPQVNQSAPANRASAPQPRMTQPNIDESLSNARAAIARNPASRGAVIQRLRENGINPSGL